MVGGLVPHKLDQAMTSQCSHAYQSLPRHEVKMRCSICGHDLQNYALPTKIIEKNNKYYHLKPS